jgi:hypothetical protein
MKAIVIAIILASFEDKDKKWAEAQLERILRNIDCPPTPEIYENIMDGEFGIKKKLKRDHTLSILEYSSGDVILFSVPNMDNEETEDFIESKNIDSSNCCFMTFEGTQVVDNR